MGTSATGTKGKLIDLKKSKKEPSRRHGQTRRKVAKHILKEWEPSSEECYAVKVMVAGGMKIEDIARCIHPLGPISVGTLRNKFREELKDGKADLTRQVVSVATDMALSGKYPQVTMFWLKAQAGWKDSSGSGYVTNSKFGTQANVTDDVVKKLQLTARYAVETLPSRKTGTNE